MSTSAAVPDERFLHVLSRRVRWKSHWALRPNQPIVMRGWWDGMTLVLPRSGSAATAYYRRFPSEAIARWMSEVLRPGMTVVDVGAHVGVYSMLAARLVGASGVVHAIEPQQQCASLVDLSGALNELTNLRTHCLALADTDGELGLVVDQRTMGGFAGSLREGDATVVPAQTLQTFVADNQLRRVDLLKVDAAGNELAVLLGSRSLLGGLIGSVICKLYHPDVIDQRFGADRAPSATVGLLRQCGYEVLLPTGQAAQEDALDLLFEDGIYGVPVLALRPRDRHT